MKRCKKCLLFKSREDFYSHPQTADRLMSACKQCIAADRLAYKHANRERVRGWRRAYEKTPQFKERRNYRLRRQRARLRIATLVHGVCDG